MIQMKARIQKSRDDLDESNDENFQQAFCDKCDLIKCALWLCTICNIGIAIINMVQMGKNQMKIGQSSFWAIPNRLGQV